MKKIFVVIVTYKGHKWYERCFTSLRNSEYPVQTIVIDNASNDGTVEYIREHFPEIHLIESNENLGFGRANNIGMRYALDHGCDYVFLLNQDAWIEPNTLGELVRVAENNLEYGILSPMHLDADKHKINMALNDGGQNLELLSDIYCQTSKDVYTITYANAAAWLLPRKTLETIGGFCPLFFYCGEDDDYLNRMKYHKIKVGLCPSARVVHDTKVRLEYSAYLSQKAQREGLYEVIDINSQDPFRMLVFHIRKSIKYLVKCNKIGREYHYSRAKTLFSQYKMIKQVRSQHKIRQSNWL